MTAGRRRGLPDNLDPLVDTLFNVVGILVFIVALTQLQLGDAIERLMSTRGEVAVAAAEAQRELTRRRAETERREARLAALAPEEAAILRRSTGDLGDAADEIEWALEALAKTSDAALGRAASGAAGQAAAGPDPNAAARARLERARQALDARTAAQAHLRAKVPEALVARLPDPAVLRGREQWILCRYQRCYPADRTALIQGGSEAVSRVLQHNRIDDIRPDEFESLAHHFRKRPVGDETFRWQIVAQGRPRARLAWRAKEGGFDRLDFAQGQPLSKWLAARSPSKDFIRFWVWNDSFDVYLRARQATEAAGFRAGWRGRDKDQELDLLLTFGAPPPRETDVRVD